MWHSTNNNFKTSAQASVLYNGLENYSSKFTFTSSSIPFYKDGLTLIPAWISNYMLSKVWDEITYPFLNFNGATVEV